VIQQNQDSKILRSFSAARLKKSRLEGLGRFLEAVANLQNARDVFSEAFQRLLIPPFITPY